MGAKRAASAHRPQDPLEAAVRREYPKLIQRGMDPGRSPCQ